MYWRSVEREHFVLIFFYLNLDDSSKSSSNSREVSVEREKTPPTLVTENPRQPAKNGKDASMVLFCANSKVQS